MPNPAYDFRAYPNATPFLHKMRTRLEASEARNGLMLGLALRVEQDPHYHGDDDPYFVTVENGITIAALMTPPHGVVLYSDHDEVQAGTADALQAIAHNLHSDNWAVPTVHGPSAVSNCFAETWGKLVNTDYTLDTELRAFELREVDHPTYSPGYLRKATEADFDLVDQWIAEFDLEALSEQQNAERRHKVVSQKIADGHFFLWDNGEPVSLAGVTRPTTRGISIGPVYTPPNQRGHGYASAAVARLSQDMLDSGKEFCALFTDLANPTSNSIYQKIGYRSVGDFSMVRFGGQ